MHLRDRPSRTTRSFVANFVNRLIINGRTEKLPAAPYLLEDCLWAPGSMGLIQYLVRRQSSATFAIHCAFPPVRRKKPGGFVSTLRSEGWFSV